MNIDIKKQVKTGCIPVATPLWNSAQWIISGGISRSRLTVLPRGNALPDMLMSGIVIASVSVIVYVAVNTVFLNVDTRHGKISS